MHSGLIALGKLEGGINTITEAFLEVLPEGLLVIPSFTYSWCKNQPYDALKTECPAEVGNYSQQAWKDSRFARSGNPNFAVAALKNGKNDHLIEYAFNIGRSCFGRQSIFDNLYQKSLERKGYVLLLGGAHSDCIFRSTFIHYVEEQLKVPSRYLKRFYDPLNSQEYIEQLVRFVSLDEYQQVTGKKYPPYSLPVKSDYGRLGEDLVKESVVVIKPFGYSQTRMVPIVSFCNFLKDKFIQNPDYCVAKQL